MTGLTTVPPEVEQYLAAVRESLADLPPLERDDLLAEVEASLAEAAADTDSLAATLGRPEEFAAELRSAAGLQEPTVAGSAPPIIGRARALLTGLAERPHVASARRAAIELAPIWWVVRGYVAVAVAAHLLQTDWSSRYAFIPHFGSAELGLAIVVLAVAVSVLLGLRGRRRAAALRFAALANVALAIAAIPVADAMAEQLTRAQDNLIALASDAQPQPVVAPTGLIHDGQPVRNIYPFSRQGRLLHDILLYDDLGRPLELPTNRALDPDRRVVVTNGNRPLFNVFPIRYYEPGTKRVARPNAAPYIELPLVITPPLPDPRKARQG